MSGAYTVVLENEGVVPIVPVQHTGAIQFGRVFLSLSWDNLTETIPPSLSGRMRIWTRANALRFDGEITIPRGRTFVREMESEHVAVSFVFFLGKTGIQNVVTALVEYE